MTIAWHRVDPATIPRGRRIMVWDARRKCAIFAHIVDAVRGHDGANTLATLRKRVAAARRAPTTADRASRHLEMLEAAGVATADVAVVCTTLATSPNPSSP